MFQHCIFFYFYIKFPLKRYVFWLNFFDKLPIEIALNVFIRSFGKIIRFHKHLKNISVDYNSECDGYTKNCDFNETFEGKNIFTNKTVMIF